MQILLAIDGSETAQAAVGCLMRFPFPRESEVTVLTVIDKTVFQKEDINDLNEEQQHELQKTESAVQQGAEELLAREVARLKNAGWSVSGELRSGHPAEEIVRVAGQLQTDCIVVGSHGMGGIKRFLLGSVSDHVLQYAPCSVLIVKKSVRPESACADETGGPVRILLAYDDSGSSRNAVDFCAALPLDERAAVSALSVLPMVTLYRQDIRQQLSWLWQEKKKQARAALDEAAKELGRATPHVEVHLREAADVSDEILSAANEYESDLIVLGHKGKGAIKKFLLGSVTTRIAHHAECSVLAVRQK